MTKLKRKHKIVVEITLERPWDEKDLVRVLQNDLERRLYDYEGPVTKIVCKSFRRVQQATNGGRK